MLLNLSHFMFEFAHISCVNHMDEQLGIANLQGEILMNCLVINGTHINCYTENDVITIGIGDDPMVSKNYLIISRFDEYDIDNSIGIQTSLSDYEIENAIDEIIFEKKTLIIKIKEMKVKEVNNEIITVKFSNQNIDYKLLNDYFHKIVKGSSIRFIVKI